MESKQKQKETKVLTSSKPRKEKVSHYRMPAPGGSPGAYSLEQIVSRLHLLTADLLPGFTPMGTSDPMVLTADLKRRLSLAGVQAKADYNERRREVLGFFFGGTQFVEVTLSSIPITLTSSAGSVANGVAPIDYNTLHSELVWGSLFDEYQCRGSEIYVYPGAISYVTSAGNPIQVVTGVIDYVNNAALTSAGFALAYDTRKLFDATVVPANRLTPTIWRVIPVGQPDLVWNATNINTTQAWFKTYSFSYNMVSTPYANLYYQSTLRYRQSID